jgi:hypothetical protein
MLEARLLRYSHATDNSVLKKLPHTEVNISNEMGVHRMNSFRTTKHNFRGKSLAVSSKNGSKMYGTLLALWPKQKHYIAVWFLVRVAHFHNSKSLQIFYKRLSHIVCRPRRKIHK